MEVLLLDVLPLLQLPDHDLHNTRDELTVNILQAVLSGSIPAPYNLRAQVLLGGSYALRALRVASSSKTEPTDPLVLLFALTLPEPSEKLISSPLDGRAVDPKFWLACPTTQNDNINSTDSTALSFAQRSKLYNDLTLLVIGASNQRRRVAAAHTHRSVAAETENPSVLHPSATSTTSLAHLENSLHGLVPNSNVNSPSHDNTIPMTLPLEASPIFLALRLAASSRPQDAANLYWFSSGRQRGSLQSRCRNCVLEANSSGSFEGGLHS